MSGSGNERLFFSVRGVPAPPRIRVVTLCGWLGFSEGPTLLLTMKRAAVAVVLLALVAVVRARSGKDWSKVRGNGTAERSPREAKRRRGRGAGGKASGGAGVRPLFHAMSLWWRCRSTLISWRRSGSTETR